MNTVFDIIKGLAGSLSELLPLSGNGFRQFFDGIKITYTGADVGIWFAVFANLGVLAALAVLFKSELAAYFGAFVRLAKKLVKKDKTEKSEDERELLLFVCAALPMLLWPALRYPFGFIYGNNLTLAIAFAVSGSFLLAADRIKRKELPAKSIKATDGVLIGIFRLMGFIPGISGTGGVVFSGLLSGLSEKLIYRFSMLMCLLVLAGRIITNLPAALGVSLDVYSAVGCVLTLAFGFMSAYHLAGLFEKMLKNKKLKIFSYILFAAAVISLILWMRG